MPTQNEKKGAYRSIIHESYSLQATATLHQLRLLQHERELLAIETKALKQRRKLFEQRAEHKLRLFLDSIPCLIADIDSQQRIRFCNKFYASFFGLPPKRIIGGQLWDVFSAEDYDAIRPTLLQALAGAEVTFDGYIHGKQQRYIHGALTPHYSDASVDGAFVFLTDITQRKVLEDKQKENEKRLAELLRQAEAANKLKDNFLATLSHELRTPLTSIVGWSTLINDKNLSPERMAIGLKAIERNARIQSRLIEDLLDVSRMSAGKVRLQMGAVNMKDLAQQMVDSMRPSLSEKRIDIQLKVPSRAVPTILGDAGRLQQVIGNLLANAVKFTPSGGHIKVELHPTRKHLDLIVKDDGPGIPKKLLPHIFDEFRQGDMSSTRPKGGLGLGLSIARRLVELHHGSIRGVCPRTGGATFIVRLPYEKR